MTNLRLPPLFLFETRTKAEAPEFLGTEGEEKQRPRLPLCENVEEDVLKSIVHCKM